MIRTLRGFTYGAIVFFILAASGSTLAQVKDRQLTPVFDFTTIQMPVEILSIKLNGKDVQPGEKIRGDESWLHGLSFTLKNISDKPLAYVSVGLQFPQPKRVVGYFLNYGVDFSRGEPRRDTSPPAIQPGETFELALTKENYRSFLYVLAQAGGSSDFDTAKYYIDRVSFENERDVIWEGGYLKRRDPSQIGKFDAIERYVLPAKQE